MTDLAPGPNHINHEVTQQQSLRMLLHYVVLIIRKQILFTEGSLTVTLALGNLAARCLVLTPTEHPTSRMSVIMDVFEYCR